MSANRLIKGHFGRLQNISDINVAEFGLSMVSQQHWDYHDERHEYDPVRGWCIMSCAWPRLAGESSSCSAAIKN